MTRRLRFAQRLKKKRKFKDGNSNLCLLVNFPLLNTYTTSLEKLTKPLTDVDETYVNHRIILLVKIA